MAQIIDAGIFIILTGVAFSTIFMSSIVKYGFVFKLVGAFLFFALGLMMNAEYDVAFTTTTIDSDGGNTTNIRYLIGDASESNGNSAWLGWLFIGLALLWVGLFFTEVLHMSGWG